TLDLCRPEGRILVKRSWNLRWRRQVDVRVGDAALKRSGELVDERAGATAEAARPASSGAIGIRPLGALAAAWGLGGVALLLLQAMARLTPLAVEGLTAHRLAGWQWALAAVWVLAM